MSASLPVDFFGGSPEEFGDDSLGALLSSTIHQLYQSSDDQGVDSSRVNGNKQAVTPLPSFQNQARVTCVSNNGDTNAQHAIDQFSLTELPPAKPYYGCPPAQSVCSTDLASARSFTPGLCLQLPLNSEGTSAVSSCMVSDSSACSSPMDPHPVATKRNFSDDSEVFVLIEKYSLQHPPSAPPASSRSKQEILSEIMAECESIVTHGSTEHCQKYRQLEKLPTAVAHYLPQSAAKAASSKYSHPHKVQHQEKCDATRPQPAVTRRNGASRPDIEKRRRERRERNRLAAQRYRQRRQTEHEINQAAMAEQRAIRRKLVKELRSLKQQVRALRKELIENGVNIETTQ